MLSWATVSKGSFEGDIGPYKGHSRLHWKHFGLWDLIRALYVPLQSLKGSEHGILLLSGFTWVGFRISGPC